MRAPFKIEDLRNSACARLNAHLFPDKAEVPKKQAKYQNIKEVDEFGNKYDSQKEGRRHRDLKLLLKAGEIGFIARQVEYTFHIKGGKVASYFADFVYTEAKTGNMVVEDVKSKATRMLPTYRLKRKMMWLQHGINIQEV